MRSFHAIGVLFDPLVLGVILLVVPLMQSLPLTMSGVLSSELMIGLQAFLNFLSKRAITLRIFLNKFLIIILINIITINITLWNVIDIQLIFFYDVQTLEVAQDQWWRPADQAAVASLWNFGNCKKLDF